MFEGLQIPMHDARRMRARQTVGHLDRDPQRFRQSHAAARNQSVERTARDKLHRDEVRAISLRNLMNRDDIRMAERRGRPRLLHKAPPPLRIRHLARQQQLERHEPVELRIARLVDHAHAALSQLFEHLEVGERAPGH